MAIAAEYHENTGIVIMTQQKHTALKKQAVKGAGILFSKHIVSFVINFAGGVLLARHFGPQLMGLYFVSFSVFTIFRELIEWGMHIHLIRSEIEPTDDDLRTAFTVQQIVGLSVLVLTVLVVGPVFVMLYHDRSMYPLVLSGAFGAYFYAFTKIPVARFERRMAYVNIAVTELLEVAVFNVVAVAAMYMSAGTSGFVAGNILRGLAPLLFVLAQGAVVPGFVRDGGAVRKMAKETSSIVGANFSIWLVIIAPSFLVGSMAGAAALGISQVAYTVLNQTTILSTVLNRVFLAFLARVQDNREVFNRYVNKLMETSSIIYILLIMSVASLSTWWAPLLYGAKWNGVEKIIILASWPVTQTAVLGVLNAALMAGGHARTVFKQNMVYAALYWLSMFGFLWAGMKEYSIPCAHFVGVQYTVFLLLYYQKLYGRICWRRILMTAVVGFGVSVTAWYVARGSITYAVLLWVAALLVSCARLKDVRETVLNIRGLMRGNADRTEGIP